MSRYVQALALDVAGATLALDPDSSCRIGLRPSAGCRLSPARGADLSQVLANAFEEGLHCSDAGLECKRPVGLLSVMLLP
jgi:hypothetical protein